MTKRICFLVVSLLLLAGAVVVPAAKADEVSVGNAFIEAFDKKDEAGMANIIKARAKEVPDEVKSMVEYAMSPNAKKEEQEFLFNIAGMMSSAYQKVTGDDRLLNAVKANYQTVMEKRGGAGGGELDKKGEDATKKELSELGKGDWRIVTFKMDQGGELLVEIDVKESSGGEGVMPKIEIAKANKARDILKKNLPGVKKGKIYWISAGVGIKTIFIE